MVNMYSMGMMGTGFHGGMYNQGALGGTSTGNVHQQLKQRYGVGHEDFGTRPYAQPYPFAIIPRQPEPPCAENTFCRFLKKCFS